MKMEIKENMKMYDVLFGIKTDNLKVIFTNDEGKPFSLSKAMMKQVYDYLNEPVDVKMIQTDVSEENKITDKQKAIEAMKNAVNKRKKRLNIDNKEVVKLKDEDNISFSQLAKKYGCSLQTVINRYNEEKGIKK